MGKEEKKAGQEGRTEERRRIRRIRGKIRSRGVLLP
jgi:hypothetical protein